MAKTGTRGTVVGLMCVVMAVGLGLPPWAWGVVSDDPPLPAAAVVTCAPAPVLDGVLDDACWKTAAVADNFFLYKGEGKRLDVTTVRITADNTWLFLAFTCANPGMKFLKQTVFDHDAAVNHDDSVEIFLDPGTGGTLYYHYLLSFANVKGEKRVMQKSSPDVGWNVTWRSATKVTDTGWNAEVAIPLFELVSYGDLTQAKINFARNRVVPEIDPYGMQTGEDRDNSTWSPVVNSFHEADRFGALQGLDKIKVRVPFLGLIEDPKVGAYYQAGGKFHFDVTFTAKSLTPESGALTVVVVDTPASGAPRELFREVALKGNDKQAMTVSVPVDSLTERRIVLVVRDPRTAEQLQGLSVKDTAVLNLMSVHLDRSYYTTEQEAIAVCTIGMPEDGLVQTALFAKDQAGEILGRLDKVAGCAMLPINLKTVPIGAHEVTVEFRMKTGELIFSKPCELIKRAPKPGFEWKTDRINRILLRDGKPFFPFGIILAGINAAQDDAFRAVAECGFNVVIHWRTQEEPESVTDYNKVAAKYNLLVMGRPEGFCKPTGVPLTGLAKHFQGEELAAIQNKTSRQSLTAFKCELVYDPLSKLSIKARIDLFNEYYNTQKDRIYAAVELMAKDSNLLGYNMFDEPFVTIQDEALRDLYRKIQEVDGYRPTFVFGAYEYEGKPFAWADVIEHHPYWVPTKPGSANRIGHTLDDVARASREQHRPFDVVHLSEFRSGADKRPIMRDEQFCQCYIALIHGVSGLYFFRWPIQHEATWNTLKELSAQIQVLGPIVLTPEVRQSIKYDHIKAGPEKDQYGYPDINVALKRNPAGGHILLAANARPYPVTVEYRLSCLGEDGTVGRLFASNAYPVSKGGFSDQLDGYAVRAYTLAAKDAATEPVEIEVKTTARAENWKPEEIIQYEGRPNKKNIVRNPGIEESTLSGWPDYFLFTGWWEPSDGRGRAGSANPFWGPTTENPHEGQTCLRIVNEDSKRLNGFNFYLAPQHDRPTQYTYSVYLRADRDGVDACFEGVSIEPRFQWFKLTKEWRRYSTTIVVPPRAIQYSLFGIGMRGQGTMYVDAVQMEQGGKPTAFEN